MLGWKFWDKLARRKNVKHLLPDLYWAELFKKGKPLCLRHPEVWPSTREYGQRRAAELAKEKEND